MMSEPRDEFAEEYTSAERVRLVIAGFVAGALVVIAGKLWLFPWLASVAACRSTLYGIFAGIPAFTMLVVLAIFGLRARRILRDGQYPPRGSKVLRPTRIVRGATAKRIAFLHTCAPLPLLVLTILGILQVSAMAGAHSC